MSKYPKMAVVAAVALSFSSFVQQASWPKTLCEGFLPANSMRIPVGDVNAAGISQDVFNSVLDRAQQLYGPIIASKGGKFVINRKWTDPTVNASAEQSGNKWIINMYGGLARHSAINEQGFALVVCHELGHHLGGFPQSDWATNEGGADYFSTLKCMRRWYGTGAPSGPVDPVAAEACNNQFANQGERNRCQTGTQGGSSVATLLGVLGGGSTPPKFDTPDPTVVDSMMDEHPPAQCRLDTYFQGALCQKSVGEDVANDNPNAGACTRKGGQQTGLRPRCWYFPPAGEPASSPAMASRPPLNLPSSDNMKERIRALQSALSGRGV